MMGAKRVGMCSVMSPFGTLLRAVALWLCLCAGRAFLVLRPSTVGPRAAARGGRLPSLVAPGSHQGHDLHGEYFGVVGYVPNVCLRIHVWDRGVSVLVVDVCNVWICCFCMMVYMS